MKNEFSSFVDLIEKNIKHCPWTKGRTLENWKEEIIGEAKEVAEAIDEKNYDNLKEELGDLFWDVSSMIIYAEKCGYFKSEEVLKAIKEKIERRKPYLQDGRKVTTQEALEIWNEAKKKENKKARKE